MRVPPSTQPQPQPQPQAQLLLWGVFVRVVGLCHLCLFLSLAPQLHALLGPQGVLPATPLLRTIHTLDTPKTYTHSSQEWALWLDRVVMRHPTVLWVTGASPQALTGLLELGTLASGGIVCGIPGTRVCMLLCYLCHLSLEVVGGDFLHYPWDFLQMEISFLAMFLPGLEFRSLRMKRLPHPLVRLALNFLLFRLMFGMGLQKFWKVEDPRWTDHTFIYHYYEWQPMPTWGAWFLHAYAPMWLHKLSSVATWVSEIVAPLMMLGPSRLRLLAGLSFLSVMAMISATGNFGTFQILTVALSLLCFDGQPFFRWQTSTASSAKAMARVPKTGKRKCRSCGCRRKLATLIVYVAMTTSLVVGSLFLWHHFYKFSWLSHTNWVYMHNAEKELHPLPAQLLPVFRVLGPWHIVHKYGIFRTSPPQRLVFEFQATDSLQGDDAWEPLYYRWSTQNVTRIPPFVAPHHPRLDHQFFYMGMGLEFSRINGENTLYGPKNNVLPHLLAALFRDASPVWSLFTEETCQRWQNHPPKRIRILQFHYRFTTAEEHHQTGAFWVKTQVSSADGQAAVMGPFDQAAVAKVVKRQWMESRMSYRKLLPLRSWLATAPPRPGTFPLSRGLQSK